ncbi:MAG: GNAT family N-acetyltransferase, partial [Clostridia bacterium]|nr:GNAT family N-acetyltransferase [Clostridia bacterium]
LALRHPVAKLGYEPDLHLTHSFLMHFRTSAPCPADKILPSTVQINNIENYTDLTDTDFSTDEFPVFATLYGGSLVCTCGVNDFIDENTVEIAVETVEKHRGNGYARSCVCAMVNYLTDKGYEVAYQCYPDNTASMALADACGLSLYSRDYHFVCYEKEE